MSEDERIPPKHRFKHVLDELYGVEDDNVEETLGEETLDEESHGSVAYAEDGDTDWFEQLVHRQACAHLPAIAYCHAFDGTPDFDQELFAGLLATDIARAYDRVSGGQVPSEVEIKFLTDIFTIVGRQQLPITDRENDMESWYGRATRSVLDVFDAHPDEVEEEVFRTRRFLCKAHELGCSEVKPALELIEGSLDYLLLCAAHTLYDQYFVAVAEGRIKDIAQQRTQEQLRLYSRQAGMNIPKSAYTFLTQSVLTLENHAGVFDVEERLIQLSREYCDPDDPARASERDMLHAEWHWLHAMHSMSCAMVAPTKKRRAHHLRYVAQRLENCELLAADARKEIIDSLGKQVKVARVYLGEDPVPKERPRPVDARSPQSKHVLPLARNYARRRT
ncbi:hypothetical protein GF342_02445 [Candidatus Woesearchaeota archaeon]|nr:hypothetical protein [Candidatus Woesearchaeota archaeon]